MLWGWEPHMKRSGIIIIYFFLKHLSGPESQILESDWLIQRTPAVWIFPYRPHIWTAPSLPGLQLF